jgi:hypothetical protein
MPAHVGTFLFHALKARHLTEVFWADEAGHVTLHVTCTVVSDSMLSVPPTSTVVLEPTRCAANLLVWVTCE